MLVVSSIIQPHCLPGIIRLSGSQTQSTLHAGRDSQDYFVFKQEKTLSDSDKQFATVFIVIMGALGVLAIILVLIAGYLTRDVSSSRTEEVILENIKPVGQVYIAGESAPEEIVAEETLVTSDAGETVAVEPMSGEQIYQSKCNACHGTGVAGAPKLDDAEAWAPRIAQGMDTLLANATTGLNAMPPKGTCADCSEADLKAAVEYMVEQVQ